MGCVLPSTVCVWVWVCVLLCIGSPGNGSCRVSTVIWTISGPTYIGQCHAPYPRQPHYMLIHYPSSTQQGTHTVYIQYALTIYTSQVDPGSPSKTVLSGRSLSQCVVSGRRSRLVLLLEVGVFLTLSQSTRYLVDPSLDHRDKQQLKKELGSELVSVLQPLINRVCSVTRVLVVQIQ